MLAAARRTAAQPSAPADRRAAGDGGPRLTADQQGFAGLGRAEVKNSMPKQLAAKKADSRTWRGELERCAQAAAGIAKFRPDISLISTSFGTASTVSAATQIAD